MIVRTCCADTCKQHVLRISTEVSPHGRLLTKYCVSTPLKMNAFVVIKRTSRLNSRMCVYP